MCEFTARLTATADGKKLVVKNKKQADGILAALDGRDYTITKIEKGKRRRQPPPPFITSTLQQDASRAFGFSATRTMRAAQTLYEGVEVQGYGKMGLITYMRTDSLRIAAEAQASGQDLYLRSAGATTTSARPPASGKAAPPPRRRTPTKPSARLCPS